MLKQKFLWAAVIALLVAAALLILLSQKSMAHDWYDFACCSGQDCVPVNASSVSPTPGGWLIKETGEVIPYGDPRERKSKDSGFHRCKMHSYINGVKADATRCLYVPDFGS